jgi:ribonuclease Z
MRPSFYPRLLNGPFDDPGVFIPLLFKNRAVLFDLGDISAMSSRDILKITHVFVTHTHMDHFVGFDRLLRLFIGRDKTLHLFGPAGFLKNVEGKLAGYTWNLVENYEDSLVLEVAEVHPDRLCVKQYRCRQAFRNPGQPAIRSYKPPLHAEPMLTVSAIVLDHRIPCLGFSLKEQFHVNIRKDALAALGLEPGPWLQIFKEALYERLPPDTEIVADVSHGRDRQRFGLEELAQEIAHITPGQKISYITDVGYSPANAEKIVAFVKHADHLYIEAAFLDRHRDIALKKYHLTARQAGTIAGQAQVKQFTPFHFSPRYVGQEQQLQDEARQAYAEAANREALKLP